MGYKAVLESISLDRIDWKDQRYQISTGGLQKPLVASIELNGTISPPVLLPNDSSFIIVSGFKRLSAIRQLGKTHALSQILDPKTSFEKCIRIAIIDNAFLRQLNAVEQARAVMLLELVHSDDTQLCAMAKNLGMAVNKQIVRKLRCVAQMNPSLQQALIEGSVALPVALRLYEMEDSVSADQLTEMFRQVGLSLNRQREMLDWLVGISRRDGVRISSLLADEPIGGVLLDADMDSGQKSRLLRQHVRQMRYPEITRTERRFLRTVRSLKLDKGVQVIPPVHFEGQSYSLKIDFNNHEELVARLLKLTDLVDASAMAPLFETFNKDDK